ncbi:MAG TPA: tyrosine--tRNA ligase [Armatimonadetes bacterium]|nr:tyrosine--tRNA ligase [Armatimonadota bacterium]
MREPTDLERQLALIRRGTACIVPEEDLWAKLEESLRTGRPLRVKLGIDPTAPDIHLGFAVVLRKLRQFQDLGHEVTIIIGDFTALIGDPSGQSKTRPQLSPEEIEANARTYAEQYSKILDREKTRVVFNSQWLGRMSFAEVVHLAAKATVARILERDDFTKRLREGREIRLHELLYPLCQAYDSVYLKADIEVGGLDQTFNILMGRELQREFGQEPQVGLFLPLLVGLDGKEKMSKSLGNYIGINEPPPEMYGKIMSLRDEVMPDYYRLCTDVPEGEIEKLLQGDPLRAKKRLAREIVTLYHGPEAARAAEDYFTRTVQEAELPRAEEVPTVYIPPGELKEGKLWIVKLLCLCGFASTNSEARRLITQGGVRLNGRKITDPNLDLPLQTGDIVQKGTHSFRRVVITPEGGGNG